MSYEKEIKRIKEIINRIEKRTDKGDVKFMCAELVEKVDNLKKYKEGKK